MSRKFQWGNEAMDQPSLLYVEDGKQGCIVICGFCKGPPFNEYNLEDCPHCGNDLVYPRCEW